MPPEERRQRAQRVRDLIEHASLTEWLQQQFADIEAVSQAKGAHLLGLAGQC